MNNPVDNYINKQSSPQKEILNRLRKLILKTAPKITEEFKMGVPWYEGKFYLVAFKDSVNMGFAYSDVLSKFQKELKGKGKYMRHIKLFSGSDINEKKLIKIIKETNESYRNPHPKT